VYGPWVLWVAERVQADSKYMYVEFAEMARVAASARAALRFCKQNSTCTCKVRTLFISYILQNSKRMLLFSYF